MNHFILDRELPIRLFFFASVLLLMAVWELLAPRRFLRTPKGARWFCNLGMVFIDSLALRFLMPVTAMAAASSAAIHGWGLFHTVAIPAWLAVALSVAALDLVIYVQHVLFHAVPVFWRLHRVHHTDLDIDVTTGVRFHPVEVLLSMGIKSVAALILGAPVLAVLIFEVLLNGTSMFNHGNVRMGERLDAWVRLFVVTPDMHRVHHSVIIRETNSNYGFNLPWWDRFFGTYRPRPDKGHDRMVIGLARYRDTKYLTLPRLIVLPFLHE